MKEVIVEIDGEHNENLYFRPILRKVRGRFDYMRMGEPMAKVKAQEWPNGGIPSQRLGVDPDGVPFLEEPLHEDRFAPIREKIERMGQKLEPNVQTFEQADLPSFYFWLKRAVDSGLAKIVKGKIPDIDESKVTKNFILGEPQESPVDKLTAAIQAQTEMFSKLLTELAKK